MQKVNVKGFTLIELMITVAIIGSLSAIAYPSYTEFVIRSNRAEAQSELLRLANRQEQYYMDNRVYTVDMTFLGAPNSPFITESGNYSISATVNNGTFILSATALLSQLARDTDCPTFTITETGAKGATSNFCWEK